MFDRYSTASRRAVFLARAEAGFVVGATLIELEKIVAEVHERFNQEGAPFSSEDLQFLMGLDVVGLVV